MAEWPFSPDANNSAVSSNSGKSGSTVSQGSKPVSGSSSSSGKSSSGSGKSSCTPYTIHHDAVTHQETTYTTVHHDAVTTQQWVEESPAWDENQYVGMKYICNDCGAVFDNIGSLEDHTWGIHNANNFHSEEVYNTVHHDATGHYETVVTQAAYDEQVPSGTKTVVDQAAWDEQGCK